MGDSKRRHLAALGAWRSLAAVIALLAAVATLVLGLLDVLPSPWGHLGFGLLVGLVLGAWLIVRRAKATDAQTMAAADGDELRSKLAELSDRFASVRAERDALNKWVSVYRSRHFHVISSHQLFSIHGPRGNLDHDDETVFQPQMTLTELRSPINHIDGKVDKKPQVTIEEKVSNDVGKEWRAVHVTLKDPERLTPKSLEYIWIPEKPLIEGSTYRRRVRRRHQGVFPSRKKPENLAQRLTASELTSIEVRFLNSYLREIENGVSGIRASLVTADGPRDCPPESTAPSENGAVMTWMFAPPTEPDRLILTWRLKPAGSNGSGGRS